MGLEGKVWGLAKWVHSIERSLSAKEVANPMLQSDRVSRRNSSHPTFPKRPAFARDV
jgi:hypothetical protein